MLLMTGVESTDISSRPKAAKRATARGVAGRSIVGNLGGRRRGGGYRGGPASSRRGGEGVVQPTTGRLGHL